VIVRLGVVVVLAASAVAACGAFGSGSGGSSGSSVVEDAGTTDAGGSSPDAAQAPILCGEILCQAPAEQCCLPLAVGDAGCVKRGTPCPAQFGTLQCSSPASCKAGEVCCVVPERNGGQTAYDLTRSFCSPAASCPDQPLQRQLCDQGANEQCPARACKPYLHDVSDQQDDKPVNPTSYYTCQ
jgi:hypothetical protein